MYMKVTIGFNVYDQTILKILFKWIANTYKCIIKNLRR